MNFWQRIKSGFRGMASMAGTFMFGVLGLSAFPTADKPKLFRHFRQSDLAFACIQKIVEAAQDPDLIVQRRASASEAWEPVAGHPFRQLMMRPNPEMSEAEFLGVWLASEEICGEFFAEIERDTKGKAIALWPLDPTCMSRKETGWEWRSGGDVVPLAEKDVFYSLRRDPQCPWLPLAPLSVALGSVEADTMQTAFVRSFFRNSGVPSGLIKISGRTLNEDKAEEIRKRWMRRYGFGGSAHVGPAVFDENADYQKVGSSLDEIEGGTLRAQNEARICGVFGVPPLLVSAFVGLMYVNQRASAKEAQAEFWMNKMSPTFKRMRARLTWSLFLEFETQTNVRAELVRLNWDMSQVAALQETMSERSMRAREDFRVGGLMLNEFRSILGLPPLDGANYYLRRANQIPVTPEAVAQQIAAAASVTQQAVAVALTGTRDPAADEGDKSKSDCGCSKVRKTKAFDWNGVSCWREPNEAERKANLHFFGQALDRSRDGLADAFYLLRGLLIDQAVAKLAQLSPGFYHQLILDWPTASALSLRESLSALFLEGQQLVKREMQSQHDGLSSALASRLQADDLLLTVISDNGISRMLNEIQSRASAAASQFALLPDEQFADSVRARLESQSLTFLERIASYVSASAIHAGRNRELRDGDEGPDVKDDKPKGFGYWVYNWVTLFEGQGKGGPPCSLCLSLETASLNCDALSRDEWPETPNPDCAGGYGQCRCGVWKQWWTNYPPRECGK